MLTDDWIEEIYENRVKVGIFPRLMMKELIDEIRRLRAENTEIRKWLECSRILNGELQKELDRYKTPLVDDVEFLPSDTANHEVKS